MGEREKGKNTKTGSDAKRVWTDSEEQGGTCEESGWRAEDEKPSDAKVVQLAPVPHTCAPRSWALSFLFSFWVT